MKKFLITLTAIFILNSSFLILNSEAQWVQMSNGMGNEVTAYSLAILGNNIFAGTNFYYPWMLGGVYRSTNYGTNWTQTALSDINVISLAVTGNNVFAGTDYNGIYRSTNNGSSWTLTALNNQEVRSLIIQGSYLFAGTYQNGVYLSTNNGTSWTQTVLNNKYVRSFATLGNYLFAGTSGNGVYISINYGTTWTPTLNNKTVFSLAGSSSNNIFAGTDNGAYLSTNYGMNWNQTALTNQWVHSLATLGNNVFAGTGTGVHFSSNNGANWVILNQGFVGYPTIKTLLIANSYIFAGTELSSVWRRNLSEITEINPVAEVVPLTYSLQQNFPNPFNPVTKIKFSLPLWRGEGGRTVQLFVYDVMGREVQTLVNEKLPPGTYETTFDGSLLNSGVYFYKLIADGFSDIKKMMLIK